MNKDEKELLDLYNKSLGQNIDDQVKDTYLIIKKNEEKLKTTEQSRALAENNIWSKENIAKKEAERQAEIDKAERVKNQPKHIYTYGQNRDMNTTEDAINNSLFGNGKNK